MLDAMAVYWRTNEPDEDDAVWIDLIDPQEGESEHDWVLTYRKYYGSWHIIWHYGHQTDRLLKRIPEEELRARLQTMYLLNRGANK